MSTDKLIAECREALEGMSKFMPMRVNDDGALLDSNGYFLPLNEADIRAIVTCMNALPALLDEVDRLRAELEQTRKQRDGLADGLRDIRDSKARTDVHGGALTQFADNILKEAGCE